MAHTAAALTELITGLPGLAEADPEWRMRAQYWTGGLHVGVGTERYDFVVEDGRLQQVATLPEGVEIVSMCAPADVWEAMIQPTPAPFLHDPFGAAYHGFATGGNLETVAQLAPSLRRVIELLRAAAHPDAEAPSWSETAPRWEGSVGRYLRVPIAGVEHRVYVEQCGQGIPVLLQHTAGADGRQWRHLLADPELTQRFRFIAYDLPFHGKSLPPTDVRWWSEPYRLTRDFLMAVPLALCSALELARPVFMGSSIGGHLAVDLAYFHPESFRAVIGLESAAHQDPQMDVSLLDHPRVSNDFKATLMYGLTSPTAPECLRRETAFVYSQGAPPTFRGDLHYWQAEHDLRGLAHEIDTARCAVHLLTGEYDWATPPHLTAQLAEQIPGATFQVMSGLGHFPMSEDPQQFLSYLRPVLNTIAAGSVTEIAS